MYEQIKDAHNQEFRVNLHLRIIFSPLIIFDDVKYKTMDFYIRDSKTGNNVIHMTTRVADALKDYILYERQPKDSKDKALFISKRGIRIAEHFVRNHVKERAVEAGITTRIHP